MAHEKNDAPGDASRIVSRAALKLQVTLDEQIANTTVQREFGIHRSADKIRTFLHGCLKKYLEESVYKEKDEEGNVIREILGVSKILDPVLLEEVIQFNDDLNTDRLVAAELAVALAMKLDPILGAVSNDSDGRMKNLVKPVQTRTMFPESHGMFRNYKRKLF